MREEQSREELLKLLEAAEYRLEETEYKLEEANDTLGAIRSGEIDALILKGDDGHAVFTLKSADHSFRIFIEQMSEGATTLNQDGMILYSNSSFASIVNLPLEKIIGNSFDHFILPNDKESWNDLMAMAWKNHVKMELNLNVTNDGVVPVILSLKRLELSGEPSMSLIITDLTVQKEAELLLKEKNTQLEAAQRATINLNATLEQTVEERTHALQANIAEKIVIERNLRINQERLAQILETMAEGVIIRDLLGKLTYANPMAQKIMGIVQNSAQVYIESDWKVLWVNGETLPLEYYPVLQAMSSGKPVYDYEVAIQPTEGERFYISINAAPLRDEQGEIYAGVGTFMDVTNRRKAIQLKDDFISVASHELRTPITSLKGSLQLMNKLKDRAESSVLMDKMILQANKSMNKMSVLIEDLLNSTKMSDGQLVLQKASINLYQMVRECYHDLLPTNEIKLGIYGDYGAEVFADQHKIEQVVVNFISNALKYAPNTREIKVFIEKSEDSAKISVVDDGPGIPAAKLPYLFEKYYRVDNSDKHYSGLGLGLYICSQIIEKHGGRIGAESEMGKGSTFWFSLPL